MRRLTVRAVVAVMMAFGLTAGLASTASASSWTGYNVAVSVDGKVRGRAWGSIEWIDAHHFTIPDYWVKDVSCDSHSVFSFIDVSGLWAGKKRWDSKGCGSMIDFGRVSGSDTSLVRYIGIWVCRDELIDSCTHKNFYNPYA